MKKTIKHISNSGFTLVTALFVLVVVALLSVYMINFSGVQHTTLVYGVQGARAMQAARAGLEWGIYEAINNDNCAASTTFNTIGAGRLDNFSIVVECSLSSHIEGAAPPINVYQLTSDASVGSFGSLDYVFRSLQASVSDQPP